MFRTLVLFVIALFSFSSTYSQVEWKRFETLEHKFKAEFPGPVVESKGAIPPEVGGNYYDFKRVNTQLGWTFGVRVLDDPYAHKNPTDGQLRKRLNLSRDSGVSGLDNGKLVSEKDLRLNGRLGREFIVENQTHLVITRVHHFHNRMYVRIALMRKSVSDRKEFEEASRRFLNSFEILP